MRSSVSAVFFLAMVPLGLMATELLTAGHQASNLQGTAAGETQHRRLAKKKSSRPSVDVNADSDDKSKPDRRGRRRYRWKTGNGVFRTAPPPTASMTPQDTAGDMESLLKLHNEARCKHMADPLTYSAEVATSAMEHAQVLSSSCGHIYHSLSQDRNGFGENVYQCWGTDAASCYRPESAIDALYNRELEDSVAAYGKQATQILWKSTTQLGCALTDCTLGSSNYVYLVCHYNPPGNFLVDLEDEVTPPSSTTC